MPSVNMTCGVRLYMLWNLAMKQAYQICPPLFKFFLSQDRVFCRYWPQKTDPVAKFVITVTESYLLVVLKLVHDVVTAGHPGKECTTEVIIGQLCT